MRIRLISLLGAGVLALALAAPAAAQTDSPTAQVYQGVAGQEVGGGGDDDSGDQLADVGGETTGSEVVPVAADTGEETLPFTGLELGVILMLGAALLGVGLVVRRAARTD